MLDLSDNSTCQNTPYRFQNGSVSRLPLAGALISKVGAGSTGLNSSGNQLKQVQSVTVRTDNDEELQAMHFLIQRWTMNGWSVKNISQFSRSESSLGGFGMGISSYSTIIFEKGEDASFCPICNTSVNDMKLHREWHSKRESHLAPP